MSDGIATDFKHNPDNEVPRTAAQPPYSDQPASSRLPVSPTFQRGVRYQRNSL